MAQTKQKLRLVLSPKTFCDAMVHANIALSEGNLEEAIDHYTKVLHKLAPGLTCAFLNRCMAYLHSGYYELAVMDAYRACITARGLFKKIERSKIRLDREAEYLETERLHVLAGDRWTRPKNGGGVRGWATSPLASVVINATPDPDTLPFGTSTASNPSFITALQVRAGYRLCGALLKIGGGARKDALNFIDKFRATLSMYLWESKLYNKMLNEIMLQFSSEVDLIDPEQTSDQRKERMDKLHESNMATTAYIDYGDYPWNPYEARLDDSEWQESLRAWLGSCSRDCTASIIQPEERDDSEGLKVELRVNRNFKPGEFILQEDIVVNVTTSIPEGVMATRQAGTVDFYYCNSCASLLDIPLDCPHPDSPDPDFTICTPSHIAPTCSDNCHQLSAAFDRGICGTNLEQKLRLSHTSDLKPRSIMDRRVQCLRDLLLLRSITTAINIAHHPLNVYNMVFATSGAGTPSHELSPWSFFTHVSRPISLLHRLFSRSGTDQFERMPQLEGWVISALQAKIEKAMLVSNKPRYVKKFNEHGMLVDAFGAWDARMDNPMNTSEEKEEEDKIWIARINPLIDMIRTADPAKGEVPNVDVVHRENTTVYAVVGGEEPAIRAGETLLRAPDEDDVLRAGAAVAVEEEGTGMEDVSDGDGEEVMKDFLADLSEEEESDDEDEDGGGVMLELE